MEKKFDVQAAKRAGMTNAEINQFMTENNLKPIKTVRGFLQNIPKSAEALASGIGQAITNPIETLTNIGNVAMGAAQIIMPGTQDKEKFARALGQFYVDRYGSPQKALDTLYSDPVGALSDVSTFLTGAGGAIGAASKVSRLGSLAKTGQAVSRAGAMIEPLNIAGAGLGKLPGKGLLKKAGGKIEQMGREYAKTGYGQPATLGKYAAKFRPVEDVITEYGLYGKDTQKLEKTINTIQNEFDKIAVKSGRKVNIANLKTSVKNKIKELQSTGVLEDISTAEAIKERLNVFERSLKKQTGINSKVKDIGIDVATEMRKKYDKRVKNWNAPITDTDSNRILRDIFQEEIQKATSDLATAKGENLKKTGQRLNELYSLEPIMQQAAQRGTSTRAFSLGKMVTSGVGATVAGLPGAIAGYGIDVVANQPGVISAASKATQKLGQVMQKELPKIPGMDQAKQAGNIFYQFGKAGRVTAPAQQGQEETMPTMTPEMDRQKKVDEAILKYAPSFEKIKQKRTQVSPGNAFSKVGKVSKGAFV